MCRASLDRLKQDMDTAVRLVDAKWEDSRQFAFGLLRDAFGDRSGGPSPPGTPRREELSPDEYHVLREAGTERAFTGKYTDTETKGVYSCKACGAKLFESDTKFHSGCGWPSFYQPITDTIEYLEDNTLGMKRVEVRCANCGSHLGHVFPDGYGTPTGDRCAR